MSKENSSSSGTLFARPTKEWVVPQRAKPGRKSTKQNAKTDNIVSNGAISMKTNEGDGRTTVGNRDAQRAFRERKTEYVASLEARIESYEKGEIKRNVALQVSARATKEENLRLKAELDSKTQELTVKDERCRRLEKVVVELRKRLNAAVEVARKLNSQHNAQDRGCVSTSRRGSDAFSTSTSVSSSAMPMDLPISPPDYGRDSSASDTFLAMRPHVQNRAYMPSSVLQNPGLDAEYRPTTTAQLPYSRSQPRQSITSPENFHNETRIDDTSSAMPSCSGRGSKTGINSKSSQGSGFVPCGFCSGMESICVCRSIEENDKTLQDTSLSYGKNHSAALHQLSQPQSGIDSIVNAAMHQEAMSRSILDNLPAPEAAVPLRSRRERGNGLTATSRAPIFAVQPLQSDSSSTGSQNKALNRDTSDIFTSNSSGFESGVIAMMQDKDKGLYIPPAECSGDPRNCPACKDDDFGREFCETLSTAVCNTGDPNHRCDNCADKPLPVSSLLTSNILAVTVASTSNARGNASNAGSAPPQSNNDHLLDGMEYVDIPCCGDKKLCGAIAEEDCKTTIAIPIISLNDNDNENGSASSLTADSDSHGQSDKVKGLAGGQEGSWMESERWIGKEPVGADQAWRTLKAHPNAKFCPLSMLAEVVARGTRCTFSPSRLDSPASSAASGEHGIDDKSRMSLAPLEELEGTGKRRRFEIHPDAVQRALDMLDAHSARPNKKRRFSGIGDNA